MSFEKKPKFAVAEHDQKRKIGEKTSIGSKSIFTT